MKKIFTTYFIAFSFILVTLSNCSNPVNKTDKNEDTDLQLMKPIGFVPNGFKIFFTLYTDFNKDGLFDCILIIKGTKHKNNPDGKKQDRNRRGIIALVNNNGVYEVALQNLDCFSSENENNSTRLSFEAVDDKLIVIYQHEQYGFRNYTFRYKKPGFQLIGYDSGDNQQPVPGQTTSIDFLTGKKVVRKKVNGDSAAKGDYVETGTTIKSKKLLQLSEIKDFDELDMSKL